MIGEGRPKIFDSTTDENEAGMPKTSGATKMLVNQLQQALQHNALFFEHTFADLRVFGLELWRGKWILFRAS